MRNKLLFSLRCQRFVYGKYQHGLGEDGGSCGVAWPPTADGQVEDDVERLIKGRAVAPHL